MIQTFQSACDAVIQLPPGPLACTDLIGLAWLSMRTAHQYCDEPSSNEMLSGPGVGAFGTALYVIGTMPSISFAIFLKAVRLRSSQPVVHSGQESMTLTRTLPFGPA